MPKLVLIDGNSLVYKAYYALPMLTNSEGLYTNGIYGFVMMLLNILENYEPDYIAVAFDKKAPTFRHKEYDKYKANRAGMPDELAMQLPHLKDIIKAFNISIVELDGFEADDIIGTISKNAEDKGCEVYIVTGDRDSLQLVSDKVTSVISKKGTTDVDIYTPQAVFNKFGVYPEHITDLKGLMGDSSDNIPGVPGIGEKTAAKLLKEFGTLEEVINNADKITKNKIKEAIKNNIEIAYLSKKLATIECKMPIDYDMEELRVNPWDNKKLRQLFSYLNFSSLLGKLPEDEGENDAVQYKITDIGEETVRSLNKTGYISAEYIIEKNELLYAAFYDGNQVYFIDAKKNGLALLTDILSGDTKKLMYESKALKTYMRSRGLKVSNVVFDASIAAYLISATDTSYPLKSLALEYAGMSVKDGEDLLGKGKGKLSFGEISPETIKEFISKRTVCIYKMYKPMTDRLKADDIYDLYKDIELPLTDVLSNMEANGFKIDIEEVKALSYEYDNEIKDISREIFEMAQESFNINSPKQLGSILFDKLKLPVIKKTKTGYSTDAEVLEELSGKHEIVQKILRYRSVMKLRNTYIADFEKLVGHDGRIHTTFMQTVTATGRISSTEPNLQNIPVRDEMGRRLRKVFIPTSGDYVILSADYSQIELRLLAHLSKDEGMIEAFINNEDIHTRTAAEVFGVSLENVTKEMRRNAKAVNFGIVYGISDYGLSRDLKIPREEARLYIDSYFERYPGVKKYLDETVNAAKANGFVTTIFKRRRNIPELKAKNYQVRSFGERVAMNTPIQGSAADIIKLAMVLVYKKLSEGHFKSRLILQVHDELILDVFKEEYDDVRDLVKDCMKNLIKLRVPLTVDLSSGGNWYEAK